MTDRTCSIEGCETIHYGRGWCQRHYTRWRNHGDPLAGYVDHGEMLQWLEIVAESWWPVCIDWPYPSRSVEGYGKLQWRGSKAKATTVVCTLAHGERPSGLICCHSCHRPECVNPRHLRWDTYQANEADKLGNGTYFRRNFGRH